MYQSQDTNLAESWLEMGSESVSAARQVAPQVQAEESVLVVLLELASQVEAVRRWREHSGWLVDQERL